MLAGVAALFSMTLDSGASLAYARTTSVNLLVAFEAVYLVSSRFTDVSSFSRRGVAGNPALWFSILAVMTFQIAFTYTSPFQAWFHIEPLAVDTWLNIGLFAAALLLMVELEKWLRRHVTITL
jgi:magnesium-transporting ATPase (P-type)